MTKLESIASSAVRAADKVGASLIIVYTQSGTRCIPPCSALSAVSLQESGHSTIVQHHI